MPRTTRRIRIISFGVILERSLTFLSGWTTSPGSVSFRRSSSVICVSAILEQERTIVLSFHDDCLRGGNCNRLLLNSDVSRSDFLIYVSSYHCLQHQVLVHTMSKRSGADRLAYACFVQTFQDMIFEYFTCLIPSCIKNLECRRLVKKH